MITTDFLIVGGGVIGVSVARELRRLFPGASVTIIEKENDCGMHASGRNSGVLHAGFYYTADSLKAKFTQRGNVLLTAYCDEKKLKINKCGKLVVAASNSDLPLLDELLARGRNNGVPLHDLTEAEAREIEPRVITFQRAIYSPTTSSVDPREVMRSLKKDAVAEGIEIQTGVAYIEKQGGQVKTSRGHYQAGYVVNAAGLYADSVARDFGFSDDYRILPFKGLYLYSGEQPFAVRTNIYPVPNLGNPFLGVHYTLTVDGRIKIGPTAIPAFWREQYQGLGNFDSKEFMEILRRQAGLLLRAGFDFRKLAFEELRKYAKSRMVKLASSMVSGVSEKDYRKWGVPGIRAQLINIRSHKLEMDFVLQGDSKSMHILNAVSPAFTCALPFSEHVGKKIYDFIH